MKKIYIGSIFVASIIFLSGCAPKNKETEIELKNEPRETLREEIREEKISDESKVESQEEKKSAEEPEPPQSSDSDSPAPPAQKPVEKEIVKESEDKAPDFKINKKLASWGFLKSDSRKIDTIIVHSSYNALDDDLYDLDKIIDIYKSYGVAPHYIISRDGKIYQMVADKNIAYHAGESKTPDGRANVNNFSIGIEVVNSKTEGPSGAQYGSLKKLLSYLKEKYDIKYTLGHSDIAPGRKDDPWKFDWEKLK